MGKTQHLLVLGGDEENGDALGRQRVDQSVDRKLRSYVDAARRLVRDEDARAAEQPLRKQHLLLVAPGERVDPSLVRPRPHIEPADQLGGALPFGAR